MENNDENSIQFLMEKWKKLGWVGDEGYKVDNNSYMFKVRTDDGQVYFVPWQTLDGFTEAKEFDDKIELKFNFENSNETKD